MQNITTKLSIISMLTSKYLYNKMNIAINDSTIYSYKSLAAFFIAIRLWQRMHVYVVLLILVRMNWFLKLMRRKNLLELEVEKSQKL